MKKIKIQSPISLLISIVDRDDSHEVEEYLSRHNLHSGIVFMGKGTAESEIADIFGFGMSDKDIIACIIPNEKKDKIVADINNITRVDIDKYGLNMVLKISSAGSNLLELMKIRW